MLVSGLFGDIGAGYQEMVVYTMHCTYNITYLPQCLVHFRSHFSSSLCPCCLSLSLPPPVLDPGWLRGRGMEQSNNLPRENTAFEYTYLHAYICFFTDGHIIMIGKACRESEIL